MNHLLIYCVNMNIQIRLQNHTSEKPYFRPPPWPPPSKFRGGALGPLGPPCTRAWFKINFFFIFKAVNLSHYVFCAIILIFCVNFFGLSPFNILMNSWLNMDGFIAFDIFASKVESSLTVQLIRVGCLGGVSTQKQTHTQTH